jgi:isopentenyl-diphosphate Delta-isomerase
LNRKSRKIDHLQQAIALPDGPACTGFSDLTLVHNCLPEINSACVSIATTCAGLQLQHPVIINAMTGGAAALTQVNERLATVAKQTGSVMAVGSQFSALQFPEVAESFRVVRKLNPDGIIWANIGAYASLEDAQRIVDMIEADALQVHLNSAQETSMAEGDSDFTGWLRRIEEMAKRLPVPVIVKETGCGMAMEQIRRLSMTGAKAIDVGGAGGTNFIAIESARIGRELSEDLLTWGIPTAVSALEAAEVLPYGVDLIVSGGVRTPVDGLKSFAIGAAAVGIAAPVLRLTEQKDVEAAVQWVLEYLNTLKQCLVMLGKSSIGEVASHPLVITGYVAQWLEARDISIKKYARRSM